MFDTQTYIDRRKVLKQHLTSGIILLLGNEESSMSYADNHYDFRQDSTFLYYFGLDKPHLAAIIDIDEDKEILFGDDPTIDEIVWTGPVPSLQDLARKSGIGHCQAYNKSNDYLQGKTNRDIHFLPPYRPEHIIKLQQWFGFTLPEIEKRKSLPLIHAIVKQRSIKTDEEIEQIEESVAISAAMHLEAMRSVHPGMKEYELASVVRQKALEHNGRLAFPTILTKNGQILHNHFHGNTIRDGDMVLCDAGAENEMHYAGDLTRIFPAGNRFTGVQRDFYSTVLEAQQAAAEAMKPGIPFKEVHLTACRRLAEGLKEVGLMRGNVDDAVSAGAHTLFFQCGLGHMMGLDVHDMENLGEEHVGYTKNMRKSTEFGLKSLRLARELQEGFVLTVEPGIYIIPVLIDLWRKEHKHKEFINYDVLEKYKEFGGIRIEDDYLITSEASRRLGPYLPKTIQEIEDLRSGALT